MSIEECTMADSASKRRRLSWAAPGGSSPSAALQIVPSAQHEQQDIIEFFAQRGERKKELEAQVQVLEASLQELQSKVAKTEGTVAHQKVLIPHLHGADDSLLQPRASENGRQSQVSAFGKSNPACRRAL